MKFKVGDVVEILEGTEQYRWCSSGCMKKYVGTKGKIVAHDNHMPEFEVKMELDKTEWWFNEEDMKIVKESPSTQSFTITVSDAITTLKSADKTVEIKRYHEDKHDVKVAIDNVVKKYFDEVERIKAEDEIGNKLDKLLKDNGISIDDAKRILDNKIAREIGKVVK